MGFVKHLHRGAKRLAHTAYRAARRTADVLDKSAAVAHDFLANLSPDARQVIGQALGPERAAAAHKAVVGLDR